MKYLLRILSFLIFCLSIQSCDKDDAPLDSLVGTWKVISTSGGIQGGGYNPNFEKIKSSGRSSP